MTDPTVILIQKFITEALAQVGKPYQYGANGPNAFDCSGLVQYSLEQVGVPNVPRESTEQWSWCGHVAYSNLQAGDLVFEQWPGDTSPPGHVCIYLGNNKVVEAPHSGANVWVREWSPTETTIFGYGRVAQLGNYPKPVTTVTALLKESNGDYRVVCPNCKECFDVKP